MDKGHWFASYASKQRRPYPPKLRAAQGARFPRPPDPHPRLDLRCDPRGPCARDAGHHRNAREAGQDDDAEEQPRAEARGGVHCHAWGRRVDPAQGGRGTRAARGCDESGCDESGLRVGCEAGRSGRRAARGCVRSPSHTNDRRVIARIVAHHTRPPALMSHVRGSVRCCLSSDARLLRCATTAARHYTVPCPGAPPTWRPGALEIIHGLPAIRTSSSTSVGAQT